MKDYILHSLKSLGRAFSLFVVFSVIPMLTARLACAQGIATPSGELRLGMTKDQVIHLLHNKVEEGADPGGSFQRRTVNTRFGNRRVSAILTGKCTAYSVFVQESFPADLVGKQAAETAFRSYLKIYAAPTKEINFRTSEATVYGWKSIEGYQVTVVLMCAETEFSVQISDYQRQITDDGQSDEHQQFFPESGPYSNMRCF